MKKFLTGMVAAATLFSAGAAFAQNQVQVTLTSPTIVKSGCERAGSVQFAFDGNTVIKAGDWWYLDLPSSVTLCKNIDYVIGQAGAAAAADVFTFNPSNTFDANPLASALTIGGAAAGIAPMPIALAGTDTGPISATSTGTPPVVVNCIDIGTADTVAPIPAAVNLGIVFRVVGASGSRRVTVYAIGTSWDDDANVATPNVATQTTITVATGYKMNVKILDGLAHNATAVANTSRIFTNADGVETNGTSIYGETLANGDKEVIGKAINAATVVPNLENTLCIDASTYASDLVFVSFDSLNSKFTFTGDSQIAHTGANVAITLKNCKGANSGQILIGGQNSCKFNYQTPVSGYCSTFTGNKLLVQTNQQTFGDLADKYAVTVESLTDGVYFNTFPTLKGFIKAEDECNIAGTTVAATFVPYVGSTVATSYAGTSCAVSAATRVNKVATAAGAFMLDNYDTLQVVLPDMAYDTTVIGAGTEAKVRISLDKYPCGTIFTGSQTIGTFVTTCTAAAGTTSLMFPFFPPMDPSAAPGWWGGYVIVNGGTGTGTAVLTYTDAAGATATYTTAAIAAGAQFNGSALTSTDLTPGAGTFSKTSNYSIKALCNFSMAAGFAFVSSPEAAASYVAYTSAGWQ